MIDSVLSPSLENYLRVICEVIGEQSGVRAKDIAARLEVSNASVTGALRALAKRGLINYAPYGVIALTREGRRTGQQLCRARHVLRDFLVEVLAVEPEDAEEAACKLEHAVSRPIMERFVQYFEFTSACPKAGAGWDKNHGFYCKTADRCRDAIETCRGRRPARAKAHGRAG